MATLVHNYSSNGDTYTDEYGTQLVLNRLLDGEVVEGFKVVANGSPNMKVRVQPGSGRIPTGTYPSSYGYLISHDTVAGEEVTIAPAAASPRLDYVLAYVDKAVAGSVLPAHVNNTNGVLKFVAVAGTPAGSPVVPTNGQITAVVGSNPYIILGEILVNVGAGSITNPNIADRRKIATAVKAQSLKSGQIDYSTFLKNIKSGTNSVVNGIGAGENDLAPTGIAVTFDVATACVALVTVDISLHGGSDDEFRLRAIRNGVIQESYDPIAAAFPASRSVHRSFTSKISLVAGTNVISAGVFVTGPHSIQIKAGRITAIVLGEVLA